MSEFKRTKGNAKSAPRRVAPISTAIVNKVSRVDAVLGSDLHIRPDSPLCRTDDFQAAMWKKLEFIFDLCREYNVPFLCGGDIGHRSQWSDWLLEKFIRMMKNVGVISALGQHDLPGHNLEELPGSGCGVFCTGNHIQFGYVHLEEGLCRMNQVVFKEGVCSPFHWGEEIYEVKTNYQLPQILITHRLVIQGNTDWPGQEAIQALDLLKQYPQYKLILTGDNHFPFVEEYQGRLLVNPGSMMRTTAAQVDHQPRVYLWDAEVNRVQPVFLPIEAGVVDRSHIDVSQERDERMKELSERVKIAYDEQYDFEKNMEDRLKADPPSRQVEDKIWKAIEENAN